MKVFIAGHQGLVGSALARRLGREPGIQLVTRSKGALDLRRQAETEAFFREERPDQVYMAAATVGGILANRTYTAEFIYNNLMIAANAINSAWTAGVPKLLNFGSNCVYPREAAQPLREEYLLTGPLEPTNEAYAVAKIAAIKLCSFYHRQYGANYYSVMPCSLYGPEDNFSFQDSHMLPALIRKFHLGRLLRQKRHDLIAADFARFGDGPAEADEQAIESRLDEIGISAGTVTLWGTGEPWREFMHCDDVADACVWLMNRFDAADVGELVNIGMGRDMQIREIAGVVRETVGYEGGIRFDTTKPDGMMRKLVDSTRMRTLGWEPSISLADGIAATYRWYLAAGGSSPG